MSRIEIRAPQVSGAHQVITPEALDFLELLAREFGPRRRALLQRRREVQQCLRDGALPDFLPETRHIRESKWSVAPAPADLDDRRVEITGPVERKMMINALNSEARVFMADFEDALSPPWTNVIEGQLNCREAVRRTLEYASPEGKRYRLNEQLATLVVRPRGWHLEEKHATDNGEPMSASLFDFGLYFFHNARELLRRGSGPYFYLPKLENHLEARLWNEVFDLAQDTLGIPRGTVRATVLIETILAAYEMDEILYELRNHAAGLNAGRWDYLFSIIKNFRDRPEFLLPDRSQLTMTVPFMQAYTELLVQTCHRRGAHAIGGMAAFIPSRRDPQVNQTALARVREDKTREAKAGYDGAWVAHPDLVPVVQEVFSDVLGTRPNQKARQRDDVAIKRAQLLDVRVPGGRITETGVRGNISVALQYLAAWLGGSGAVAINNLMEDAATAEIARSQLWQWIRHRARTESGEPITVELCRAMLGEERARLMAEGGDPARLASAGELLDGLFSAEVFPEFLTLTAYQKL
ncbi:MAG TPA: malate synthase A [Gemmatimonadales bacterium]|jgi:malate synthase|nr:malate synthase A [Gemmatimonadales bacterium]